MSDGQFWFVMICLVILLDLLSWKQRRADDNEALRRWKEYDEESRRRHDEFMGAMRDARPTNPEPRKQGG